jgi:hypothetical protein
VIDGLEMKKDVDGTDGGHSSTVRPFKIQRWLWRPGSRNIS